MRVPFKLTDFSTGVVVEWLFPINPKEYAPPNRRANITTARPTAPNGTTIIFQGLDEIGEGTLQGAVIGAQMYTDLREWTAKNYPLQLTDDLGNILNILVVDVSFRRIHRAIEKHRYDYTIKFMEIA